MNTEMNGIDVVVDNMVFPMGQRLLIAGILDNYKGTRTIYKRKVETFSPFATANS
jgi:hypothetical protein